MQYLDAISKTTEWSLFVSKANHSVITVIQVYALTSNAEEAEVERLYEDLQDLLELTPRKDVLFIIGDCSLPGSKCSWIKDGSDGKESHCNAGNLGLTNGLERLPWRRAWQPTPALLPGESHGTEEPGGLQSIGSQRVRHNWATNHTHTHTPLS